MRDRLDQLHRTREPLLWVSSGWLIAFFGAVAAQVVLVLLSGLNIAPSINFLFAAHVMQSFIIFVCVVAAVISRVNGPSVVSQAVNRALVQFQNYWVGLWVTWFMLYVALSVHALYQAYQSWLWELVLNLMTNLQALFLLGCYFALEVPVVSPQGTEVSRGARWYLPLWAVLGLLTAANVFQSSRSGIGGSNEFLFQVLSATAAAVSLALLAGRLDNRYINAPKSLIVLFYIYAVIQFSYVVLPDPQYRLLQIIASSTTLPLKILLFGFVTWSLRSGRILHYLEVARVENSVTSLPGEAFMRSKHSNKLPFEARTPVLKSERRMKQRSAFLCYSKGDRLVVRQLYEQLAAHGVDAWLDEVKLVPGQEWEAEITKAVRSCDAVVVCLSVKSVSKDGFVQKEIRIALDEAEKKVPGRIFIIPARLEPCTVPDRLLHLHWVDLFEQDGFEKLMRALAGGPSESRDR